MKKIYFFLGTTAELIKVAPVIREFKKRNISFKIISSNQNVLNFDELKPLVGNESADFTLKVNPFKWPRNIYLRFTIWLVKTMVNYLMYFGAEFKDKKNTYLVVHGDTVSAVMGAVVAKFYGVKLVHIESGLRSFNFLEPFPEEISRFIISYLSDIHFCPNKWALGNLKYHRGVKINTFYNTVGESVSLTLKYKKNIKVKRLTKSKYFVFVLHRQEHTMFNKDENEKIFKDIIRFARKNLKCVVIMHKLTEDFLQSQNLLKKLKRNVNVVLAPRLPYSQFLKLIKNSEFLVTDGGTNQEEAYFLGKPCLILRNRTERIEGLGGNAVLAKGSKEVISNFFNNYHKLKRRPVVLKKLPSKIIVDYLVE